MRKFVLLVVPVLIFCSAVLAANAGAGQAAYDKSCKGCHGANGAGNPAVAKALNATIPDLGSAEVQGLSDDQIKAVLNDGKGKMKPVKNLSASADDVVAYIRSLKK